MRLKARLAQIGAVGVLVLLGGVAIAGPYGIIAWGENKALLEEREARIAALQEQREEYANLVDRLDPDNVDPDLATELVRRNLNVAHPDEYIIEPKPE